MEPLYWAIAAAAWLGSIALYEYARALGRKQEQETIRRLQAEARGWLALLEKEKPK